MKGAESHESTSSIFHAQRVYFKIQEGCSRGVIIRIANVWIQDRIVQIVDPCREKLYVRFPKRPSRHFIFRVSGSSPLPRCFPEFYFFWISVLYNFLLRPASNAVVFISS